MRLRIDWRKLLLLWLAAAGCDTADQPQSRQLYAFGTVVTVRVWGTESARLEMAVSSLESIYRRIDADWYPWPVSGRKNDGELRRINKAIAAGRPIGVSDSLARLIQRSTEIESSSGGRFTIAAGQLSRLWGFDDLTTQPDSIPDLELLRIFSGANASSKPLSWQNGRLSSSSRDLILDPGGIAKGAILEISAAILADHDIDNAVIDLGGDLLVLGRAGSRATRIGIRSPRDAGIVGWIAIDDGEAVMTSGDYERYFLVDGVRYQHIVDPRTGLPVSHTVSATVVHNDPLLADAAATALIVGGMSAFDDLCVSMDLEHAMIIDSSGDMRLTRSMQNRVNWSQ